jgi:hypothetical protein
MSDDMSQYMQQLSEEFDTVCADRHEMGAEKYGALKFVEKDTIQEMIEELVDLANYTRYTYIKLRMMQDYMAMGAEVPQDTLGRGGFINMRKARGERT